MFLWAPERTTVPWRDWLSQLRSSDWRLVHLSTCYYLFTTFYYILYIKQHILFTTCCYGEGWRRFEKVLRLVRGPSLTSLRTSSRCSIEWCFMFYVRTRLSIRLQLSLRQSRDPSIVASFSQVLTRIRGFYVVAMRVQSSQGVGRKIYETSNLHNSALIPPPETLDPSLGSSLRALSASTQYLHP